MTKRVDMCMSSNAAIKAIGAVAYLKPTDDDGQNGISFMFRPLEDRNQVFKVYKMNIEYEHNIMNTPPTLLRQTVITHLY